MHGENLKLNYKDLWSVFRLRSNFISPEDGGSTLLLDVIVDAHQNIMWTLLAVENCEPVQYCSCLTKLHRFFQLKVTRLWSLYKIFFLIFVLMKFRYVTLARNLGMDFKILIFPTIKLLCRRWYLATFSAIRNLRLY